MNIQVKEETIYLQKFRLDSEHIPSARVIIDNESKITIDPAIFHHLNISKLRKEDLRDLGIFFTEVYNELMK